MLNKISTFLKRPILSAESIFIKNLYRTNGAIFCSLFNLRAFLRGLDVRFTKGPLEKQYLAVSINKKNQRLFFAKNQNVISYQRGFEARANALASAYFLGDILFSEGDVIIDCGANVGDLKLFFEFNNLQVKYIGIEPSPLEFSCLEKNVYPSKSINMGLWKDENHLDFYVSSHYADSSFIKPSSKFTEIIRIPTNRLDAIFSGNIKLLKLEAEGAEPEVIDGCQNLLPYIEYISADLGFERGIAQDSTFPAVANFLYENNFEMLRIGEARVGALFKNKKLKSFDN